MTIQLVLMLLLGILALQDFKSRKVSVLLFPAITLLFILVHLKASPEGQVFTSALICCLFVVVQLMLLAAYFWIRHGNLSLLKSSLGLGDVYLIFSLCFLFSPVNYIAFHLVSLIAGLSLASIARLFSCRQNFSIPLAGIQACLVIMLMLYSVVIKPVCLCSDHYLLAYLMQ